MKTTTTEKVWCFGRGGKVVLGGVEVKSMEHARQLAREWNKDGQVNRIEIIANAPIAAHGTKVTSV